MEKREMPEAERLAGLIGLAARARRLVVGCDQTTEAVRTKEFGKRNSGNVCLALLASDASQNTRKRLQNCCTYYETECSVLPLPAERIAHAIGKSGAVSVIALTDPHFASAVRAILKNREEAEDPREV